MPTDRVEIDILTNTKKADSGLKGLLGNLAKIGGAIAAMRGLQQVINTSIDNYRQSVEAESKLASVLESTGNVLGVTQKELSTYASELQNATGVSDDLITNSQALLATFTKIGSDVFPRATEIALDLSKAFGQDLKSSTIQIGKALQDPIQGVSALRRVGVQLSEEQTDMIKNFVELGDVASAQKVILGELETQVGGVARAFGKTTVGQMDVFKENLGDLSEGLGEAIMVGMAPFVEQANKFFQKNKTQIINIMKNLPELFLDTIKLVADILKKGFSWDNLKDTVANLALGFVKAFKNVFTKFPKMFMAVLDFLLAPVQNFGEWLGSVFKNVFGKVGNFFIDVLNKIPFVDLEKATVAPIQSFGDTWQNTLDDMGIAFETFTGTYKDYAIDLVKIAKETGIDLAKQFSPEVAAYLEKVGIIINAKEEETAAIIASSNEAASAESEAIEESKSAWEEKVDRIKEKYKEIEGVVSNVFSKIEGIVSQVFKNQEIAMIERYNKEEKAIQSSKMSEEEKQKALLDLEKKADRERAAIKRKQAIADKAAAVIKSIIDTASSVVEALPNLPLAITVGALGAAQTAFIAAQPIPAFATGGSFVTSGPQIFQAGDNSSGRERITVSPVDRNEQKTMILKVGEKEFVAWIQDQIDNGDLRFTRAS